MPTQPAMAPNQQPPGLGNTLTERRQAARLRIDAAVAGSDPPPDEGSGPPFAR